MEKRYNRGRGINYLHVLSFSMSAIPGVLVPIIPVYALHMGATQVALGLIGSIGAAMYTAFTFMLGGLWDRLGKKAPIMSCCILYAVLCSLYPFISSPIHIVALRTLEGLSWALFWPPVEALIAEMASENDRKTVSYFGVSWSSGQALGVFLSGFALEFNEYSKIFLSVSILSLFFAIASLIWIKESKDNVEVRKIERVTESASKLFIRYKEALLLATFYAFSQGIIYAFYPAYAELKAIPGFMIGLCVSLLIVGRTIAFWSFGVMSMKQTRLIGTALMSVGFLPIAFTTIFPILLACTFSVGFGSGLLYSESFQRMATADTEMRGLYTGFFEGSIGVGYLSTVVVGVVAERYLNAPYVLSSIVAMCMLLWFKTESGFDKGV